MSRAVRWAAACLTLAAPALAAGSPPRRIALPPALRVDTAAPRFRFDGSGDVAFHLDAATVGALGMADAVLRVRMAPPEVSLPVGEVGTSNAPGALVVEWQPTAARIEVRLGPIRIASADLPPGARPRRVVLRHRDLLALLTLPPEGGLATWVWTGRISCTVVLPEASQYLLCRELSAVAGDRRLSREEVLAGIRWDPIDRIAPVRIEGLSPTGETFVHEYALDPGEIDARIERALGALAQMLRSTPLAEAARRGGGG